MGQSHAGVVGVLRVRVGLEGGRSMEVVGAGVCAGFHPLIAVGTATPWRRAIAAMSRAAAAGRGPVRAARTVPPLVLGVRFSCRFRGRREVHLLIRVSLAAVLLSSSSSMGFAGGVFPVRVGHQRGVRLLLGFGPGHSPAAGGGLSGQFHASVILGGLDSDNGKFGLVVGLLIRDGRQAGAKFIAEDASEEPRVHFPQWGIVHLLPSYPQGLGEGLGVHFLGRIPLLLGRALCLVGGCGFGWGGGWAVRDPPDRGRAGEEGARDLRDTGQAWPVAADPGPLIPNRGLREGADARAVVAEQLEVEGVCHFVFTALGDLRDPFQEGGQSGVGGRGRGRRRLGSSARGPEGSSRPGKKVTSRLIGVAFKHSIRLFDYVFANLDSHSIPSYYNRVQTYSHSS